MAWVSRTIASRSASVAGRARYPVGLSIDQLYSWSKGSAEAAAFDTDMDALAVALDAPLTGPTRDADGTLGVIVSGSQR